MNSVVIRRMTVDHIGQVAELEAAVFSVPWTKGGFASALRREEAIFYVALLEEKVVGYVGVYLAADEGEITNVAVGEAYRRQGIAGRLLDELLTAAKGRGADKIFLEVRKSNSAAIRLYEKYGFQEVGVRKAFYQKPVEDALLMCWMSITFHCS